MPAVQVMAILVVMKMIVQQGVIPVKAMVICNYLLDMDVKRVLVVVLNYIALNVLMILKSIGEINKMPITTSNFMMLSHIVRPVSIALKPPSWYRGVSYKPLAPQYELLKNFKNGNIGVDEFKYRYEQDTLAKLDPYEVIRELESLVKTKPGGDLTLLSYERPGVISHRHWAADFLSCALDYQIKELSLRDCKIDSYLVKHQTIYNDRLE